MHFTSGINRQPYEANSGFLQVTSGCSHASCAFCSYFKDTRFKKLPMEEIEADIMEIPGEHERLEEMQEFMRCDNPTSTKSYIQYVLIDGDTETPITHEQARQHAMEVTGHYMSYDDWHW